MEDSEIEKLKIEYEDQDADTLMGMCIDKDEIIQDLTKEMYILKDILKIPRDQKFGK